jgi:hypothetical protein
VEDLAQQPVGEAVASLYQTSAETISNAVRARATQLAPCPTGTKQADACVRQWLTALVSKSYRRPVASEEIDDYAKVFEVGATDDGLAGGVRLVVQAILQAPSFLYRTELGGPSLNGRLALTSHELASQLSFWLLDAPPDEALIEAARNDTLRDPVEVARQVERLITTDKTRAQLTQALMRWASLNEVLVKTKDPAKFPQFAAARASLHESARRLIEDVLFSGSQDMGELFRTRTAFVDAKVAPLYGLSPPAGNGFMRVDAPAERAGLLTHPALLSEFGSQTEGQIVQRGAFISRFALCVAMQPPPAGLDIQAPGKGLTEREFAQVRASMGACRGCHALMDPYGLMLGAFDAVGAHEPVHNGVAVDTSASAIGTDFDGPLAGPVELGAKMHQSHVAAACFVQNMQALSTQRPLKPERTCEVETLTQQFENQGRRIGALAAAIAQSDSFRFRQP